MDRFILLQTFRIVDYRFNHGIDLPWDERVS
jgi:hypothetical protein